MNDWDDDGNHGPSESGRYCRCGRFWPCRTLTLINDNAALRERVAVLTAALTPMEAWAAHALSVMADRRIVSETQIVDGTAILSMARAALAVEPAAPETRGEGE